jgi:hypothetical protein
MPKDKVHLDPTHIEYWISEADKLKESADLCWAADENIKQSAVNAKLLGVESVLIQAADDAEAELSWLYPNLIAFALQHLAIGILLKRYPKRFLEETPAYQIAKWIEECDITLRSDLREILINVENAFRWSEKSPQWSIRLSAEHLRSLKHKVAHHGEISDAQKKEFDKIFTQLKAMAHVELGKEQEQELKGNDES